MWCAGVGVRDEVEGMRGKEGERSGERGVMRKER